MDGGAVWRGRLAGQGRRIAALPFLLALVGGVLALAAIVEFVVGVVAHRAPVAHLVLPQSPSGAGSARVGLLVLALALVCLLSTLPMAFLRPVATIVATSAAHGLSLALFESLTAAALVAQVVAGYRLGRVGSHLVAAAAGLPFLVIALAVPDARGVQVRAMLLATLPPMAGLAGSAVRTREEARIGSERLQVLTGALTRQSAQRERTRIARDMHDVVAHHMSTIAVQAETARLTTPGMPSAGAQRLLAIGDSARAALTEMRRLLGVLREEDSAAPDRDRRRPQPGLGELNDLLDAARLASGSPVRLIVQGAPKTLDPGVELAAYRIVQESLTNVRQHAAGAAIDVELHYLSDVLIVRVRDNGPGPSTSASEGGYGLRGMRERAAAFGGDLRAGPGSATGFVVQATLPNSAGEASAS